MSTLRSLWDFLYTSTLPVSRDWYWCPSPFTFVQGDYQSAATDKTGRDYPDSFVGKNSLILRTVNDRDDDLEKEENVGMRHGPHL